MSDDAMQSSGANPQNDSRAAQPFVIMGAKREGGRGAHIRPDNPVGATPQGRLKIENLSPAAERLQIVLLTNADVVVFIAPCKLNGVWIFPTNVDTDQRTVTIAHGVIGDTTTTDTNVRCKARSLKVGNCNIEDMIMLPGMDKGEPIIAKCDTTQKVNLTIYGLRIDK